MSKIKVILKSMIVVLVILSLPAAPLFALVSQSAQVAENCCGPVCNCCGDSSDDSATDDRQSMAAKCGCDMEESEPAEDIPPLVAPGLSNNNESTVTFDDNFYYTIDFDSPKFVLKTDIVFDDTGPPLYVVHASYLI